MISNNYPFMNVGSNSFRSYEEIDNYSHKSTKKIELGNNLKKNNKSTQNLHLLQESLNTQYLLFDEKSFFTLNNQREISMEDVAPEWFARKYKSFMYLTKDAPRKMTIQGFDLIVSMDSFMMRLLDWQMKSKYETVFITKMFLCLLDCFKGFSSRFSKAVKKF